MASTDLTSIFKGGFVAMSTKDVSSFNSAMEFEKAMIEAGLVIKSGIDFSGKIVRVPTASKPKKKNGWYVYFCDGTPAGSFGDYETGVTHSWCARELSTLSPAEQIENRLRMDKAKKLREEERQRKAEDAAERAQDILEHSKDAPADHQYVVRKCIKPTAGVKINGDGELLIPMRNEAGEICSLQRIYPDGEKKNWYGAPKGIYEIPGSTASVFVCEGWATGASISEATGATVYVGFDTGNLKRTAQYARSLNPTSRVIIAADNDCWHEDGKNPGVEFAQAAAAEVGGQVIVPDVSGISGKPTDWNDIHVAMGIEEVRRRLGVEVSSVKRRFELVRLDTVEIKETEYVVDKHLEADALGMVFGEPGKGKSFVVIDMALCVATGLAWHGHCTKQGAVIYIAGEGHSGFARRTRAWALEHGVDLTGVPFFKSTRSCQLFDIASAHEVADSVRDICEEYNVTPTLIVIDTVARNMGGDENSTPDMARFVEHIDALLRIPYKAHVMLVHHSGKASPGQARGSTVLRGALDQEYMVEMDDATHMIRLTNKKMKDGEIPPEKTFAIKQVGLGIHGRDGSEIVGACLETVNISGVINQLKEKREHLGKNEVRALKALESLVFARSREGMDNIVSVDDWREVCKNHDLNKDRFREVKTSLEAKKKVAITPGGNVRLMYEIETDDRKSAKERESLEIAPSEGGAK